MAPAIVESSSEGRWSAILRLVLIMKEIMRPQRHGGGRKEATAVKYVLNPTLPPCGLQSPLYRAGMDLTSLTYTSLVRPDFQTSDLQNIYERGRTLNEATGITGILVFNGTHFLHVFEGTHSATEDLLKRLRNDRRHTGLEVRDERRLAQRSFPNWPLEMVLVDQNYFQARDAIGDRLPSTVPDVIKMRLLRMSELISTMDFS